MRRCHVPSSLTKPRGEENFFAGENGQFLRGTPLTHRPPPKKPFQCPCLENKGQLCSRNKNVDTHAYRTRVLPGVQSRLASAQIANLPSHHAIPRLNFCGVLELCIDVPSLPHPWQPVLACRWRHPLATQTGTALLSPLHDKSANQQCLSPEVPQRKNRKRGPRKRAFRPTPRSPPP
eukprot:1144885-Pelagomonas_calceolata.AAC.4